MGQGDLIKKYIIIAHDLGGAESIYSYIQNKNIFPVVICSGPAKNIFVQNKSLKGDLFQYLEDLSHEKIDYEILIGTGWSDYEINWMKKLSYKKIKFSAFLDNWIYFKNRFFSAEKNEHFWPEKIYVLDDFAYQIAIDKLKVFVPKIINLKLKNNSHNFKVTKIDPNISYTLRYISQPLKELNKNLSKKLSNRFPLPKIDQHKVFLDLNKILKPKLNIKIKKWIINPHPAEDEKSLSDWKICSKKIKFVKSYIQKFDNDLSEFEIVFGFNSSALLKSSFKTPLVYSLCDYVNWEEKLPHPQILSL